MDPKAKAKKKAKRQRIREQKAQIESSREGFAQIMEDCLDRILPKPLPVMPMCSLKPVRVDTSSSKKPETKIQEMYRHAKYFKELGASLTRLETKHYVSGECVEYELTIHTTNKEVVDELASIARDQY